MKGFHAVIYMDIERSLNNSLTEPDDAIKVEFLIERSLKNDTPYERFYFTRSKQRTRSSQATT